MKINWFGVTIGAIYAGATLYEIFVRDNKAMALVYMAYAVAAVALAFVDSH